MVNLVDDFSAEKLKKLTESLNGLKDLTNQINSIFGSIEKECELDKKDKVSHDTERLTSSDERITYEAAK